MDFFRESGLMDECEVIEPALATTESVTKAHSPKLVDLLTKHSPESGLVRIDADTSMGPNSLNAALRACGAVMRGVDECLAERHRTVFCAVRPPGHHAESTRSMGFCIFNSIAVAAEHALESLSRIAILDFDVHHGNGTVEMFADRPDVLVCSSFQYPFYPYRFQEIDSANIVNTPLPAGTGSFEFRKAIESSWIDPIERHRPEFILVSAGFDAHRNDPLAGLELETEDYRWVTELIMDLAARFANGRVVSTLEGGYDLESLAESAATHLECLLAAEQNPI